MYRSEANKVRSAGGWSCMVGAALWIVAVAAHAETLAQWDPVGTLDGTVPLAATTVSPNVSSASTLTGGPGVTAPVGLFANAVVFQDWTTGGFDATDYMAVSITGTNITYQSVTFSLYNNFAGSGTWEVRSSVDGYASTLASGSFSDITFDGEVFAANVSAVGTQSGTVGFRIYTYNNGGTTQRGIRGSGGAAPGVGLTVAGTAAGGPVVASVPVPTTQQGVLVALAAVIAALGVVLVRRRMG
jgi:hypothetical protein